MKLLSLCVLLFLANNSCLAADEPCVWADDECQCTTAAGLKLNIHDYFSYPKDIKESGKDYTYTYSPCEQKECKKNQAANSLMCQRGSATENCGSKVKSWVIANTSPTEFEFTIVYDGGSSGRESTVHFTYKNADNDIEITSSKGARYDFVMTGRSVAPSSGPSPSKGGGSGGGEDIAGPIGLALISLFIIAVVAYFVIGGLVNYFHRGARGVEVIPNYTFWKDVPFLIKDGFLFTISPCYKPALGKISYQSL